jgi:hypothetical protein
MFVESKLGFCLLWLGGFGNQVQTLEVSSIDRLPTFGVVNLVKDNDLC